MLSEFGGEPTQGEKTKILELTEIGLSALKIAEKMNTYPECVREIQESEGVQTRYAANKQLPDEKMREAWNDGCYDAEIARRARVSGTTVKRWRESEGLRPHPYKRGWTGAKWWDQEEARRLYDKGLPDSRIAEAVGVCSQTIRKWRIENGLPNHFRKQFKEEDIDALYTQGLTDREIGRRLEISDGVVWAYRKRKGLPANIPALDADKVQQLYDQGLIDREIAERLGTTRKMVCDWRKQNGLPANGLAQCDHDLRQKMYDEGASDGQIAEAEGVTAAAIQHWRDRRGLEANYGSDRKPKQ